MAITRLRDVLGDEVYASFARAVENMTNAEMAAYAFKLIDHARADLLRADYRLTRHSAPSGRARC